MMMKITHKTVDEMIRDPGLYHRLNKPGIAVEDCDVIVFSTPFDGSVQARSGAKEAPECLRNLTYWWSNTTEDFEGMEDLKLLDWGDAKGKDREEIFAQVEDMAYRAVKSGKFFTMIGGDHSTTIPVVRGINRAVDEPVGLIHFDAHPDLVYAMDDDLESHGSVHRRTLELEHFSNPHTMFQVGIRSAEVEEFEFIQNQGIRVLTARDVDELGVAECVRRIKNTMKGLRKVYLTFDVDCLDPAYAAGTGTPQFGGLTSRQVLGLLRGVFDLPIIGYDIVEVAPPLDPSLTSVYAARKLLTECWGHHFRKQGRLVPYHYNKGE